MKNKIEFKSTKNACKLCSPLGASIVFKGVKNCLPFIHGSQGCSTYIRRYMISHFKEPVDIASSNFSEETAIYGGKDNLILSIDNLIKQYNPEVIGISTTCLSETIGDDIKMFLKEYKKINKNNKLPFLVPVSTPSYSGTHMDGFNKTVLSLVKEISRDYEKEIRIILFPSMISPADIRYLKEILGSFNILYSILPDYSKTLDNGLWEEYQKIPPGGTPVEEIKKFGGAYASIEFGKVIAEIDSAGKFLEKKYKIENYNMGIPIGIKESDLFFNSLSEITDQKIPEKYIGERSRLLDSYADGHKYIFGKKAAVYGEEDLVIAVASFLCEVGIIPVVCATGGKSGYFKEKITNILPEDIQDKVIIKDNSDFMDIEDYVIEKKPDLLIGNSKGFKISKKHDIPLIRIGFPIHDRFGASRILHIGYRGTQQLFDKIINTVIERKQAVNPVGYTYM